MEFEQIALILLGGFLSTLFQIMSSLVTGRSEKKLKHRDHLSLVSKELDDIIRHCIASGHVLKSMNLEKGIPANFHFEKMKIMESDILFSDDTIRFIDSNYISKIHRLRLEVRNLNIEVQSIIEYKNRENFEPAVFAEYMDYLIWKMEIASRALKQRLSELTKVSDVTLKRIEQYEEENKGIERRIVYEKALSDKPGQ